MNLQKYTIVDWGFEVILMPRTRGDARFDALSGPTKVERLFVQECFGVYICEGKVGRDDVGGWAEHPVSTLFYSVPVDAEALEQMQRLMAAVDGAEPRYVDELVGAARSNPEAMLGLPVDFRTAGPGNVIRITFENRGLDPVRVTGVVRAKVGVYT